MDIIELPVEPGENLGRVTAFAIRLAIRNEAVVMFTFNGTTLAVNRLSTHEEVAKKYENLRQENARSLS